jgi:hypothetical protein
MAKASQVLLLIGLVRFMGIGGIITIVIQIVLGK